MWWNYNELMAKTVKELTPISKFKRSSYETVANWIKDLWNTVDINVIRRSFKYCGISNKCDRIKDDWIFNYNRLGQINQLNDELEDESDEYDKNYEDKEDKGDKESKEDEENEENEENVEDKEEDGYEEEKDRYDEEFNGYYEQRTNYVNIWE